MVFLCKCSENVLIHARNKRKERLFQSKANIKGITSELRGKLSRKDSANVIRITDESKKFH